MAPREPETVTRKPDHAVGSPSTPAVGGGRQTPEQAAITDLGPGGRSDAERDGDWPAAAGSAPPALGGSSAGHSDQIAAQGPEAGRKRAGGRSLSEREEEQE